MKHSQLLFYAVGMSSIFLQCVENPIEFNLNKKNECLHAENNRVSIMSAQQCRHQFAECVCYPPDPFLTLSLSIVLVNHLPSVDREQGKCLHRTAPISFNSNPDYTT